MFPADFSYARARSLDEALDLLDEAAAADEEAKLIAGGQSLLPMMKLRLAAPQVLIDIADLKELRGGGWTAQGSGFNVLIGALTTYRQLASSRFYSEGLPAEHGGHRGRIGIVPAITDALSVLADPQVRARGTIGGAVAHGDPAVRPPGGPAGTGRGGHRRLARRAGTSRPSRHRAQPARAPWPTTSRTWASARYPSTTSSRASTPRTWPKTRSSPTSASAPQAPGAAPTRSSPTRPATFPWQASCAVVRLRDGLIDGAEVAVTGISPRPYRAREAERLLTGAPPHPGNTGGGSGAGNETPGRRAGSASSATSTPAPRTAPT